MIDRVIRPSLKQTMPTKSSPPPKNMAKGWRSRLREMDRDTS